MLKKYTFGNTKICSNFYKSAPFLPLDTIYKNERRTSFLLLNTHYFQPNKVGKMTARSNIDYTNYAPQFAGGVEFAYANSEINADMVSRCKIAYCDSNTSLPPNKVFSTRYLAGVDYEKLLEYLKNPNPNIQEYLKKILLRDAFLVWNIASRIEVENNIKDEKLSKDILLRYGNIFNEIANKNVHYTPDLMPYSFNFELVSAYISKNNTDLKTFYDIILNSYKLKKPENFEPKYYNNFIEKGKDDLRKYLGERGGIQL